LDNEVIVVDLLDGSYYSITGCGTAIWEYVQSGHTRDQILANLEAAFAAESPVLTQHLDQFIDALVTDKLIEPQSPPSSGQPKSAATGEQVAFSPPALRKFTDMEDVLKMDPIHDFDELGWPNQPKE
jgi:hypothetical protein